MPSGTGPTTGLKEPEKPEPIQGDGLAPAQDTMPGGNAAPVLPDDLISQEKS